MSASAIALPSVAQAQAVRFDLPPLAGPPRLTMTFGQRSGQSVSDGNKQTPFAQSFFASLNGHGSGLMTIFLYSADSASADRRGGHAWQEYVTENLDGGNYDVSERDLEALRYASDQGLLDCLPSSINLFEYGTGGKSGVHKPLALANLLMSSGKEIESYCAVDIVEDFAYESAKAVNEKLGAESYVVVGDFMTSPKIDMRGISSESSSRVVSVFGGTLANAPALHNGIVRAPREIAAGYFSKMNNQHGLGSHVVLTYHAERDRAVLLSQYKRTEAFEWFLLSHLKRAVDEGIITDPLYDPRKYWRLEPGWDEGLSAVRIQAVCTRTHDIPTTNGNYRFRKNDRMTPALSNKWDESVYGDILKKAGYEPRFCRKEGESMGVLVAKAVRSPEM